MTPCAFFSFAVGVGVGVAWALNQRFTRALDDLWTWNEGAS